MGFKEDIEERCKLITNPQYREQMKTMLLMPENKQFAEGWLRQGDYDKNMNALKEDRTKWTTWETQWKDLLAKKDAKISEYEKTVGQAQARQAELEAQLAGGNLNTGQENAALKELAALKDGMAKIEAQVAAAVNGKFITPEQLQKEAEKVVAWTHNQWFDYEAAKAKHKERLGKEMTETERNELITFMNDKAIPNMSKAWDEKYEGESKELWKTKTKEELRKEIQTEYDQKYSAALSAANIPISEGAGPALGTVQMMYQKEGTRPDLPPNADVHQAAAAAAAALRREGKF